MSTQPEPAQFNANEWTVEQMWSAFDRGELTRESLTEGISILATAAARAEVARQVREALGADLPLTDGGGGWSDGYRAALRSLLSFLEDAAPRQPEPETDR